MALYLDKSKRLCATMKVYHYLRTDSPYEKDQKVTGTLYAVSYTHLDVYKRQGMRKAVVL